jgi:hypothetical protein
VLPPIPSEGRLFLVQSTRPQLWLKPTLRKTLTDRLTARGLALEWAEVMRDLGAMTELELQVSGKRYLLRTPARGAAAKTFTACGLASPTMLREIGNEAADER